MSAGRRAIGFFRRPHQRDNRPLVLLTGANGLIGRVLQKGLCDAYSIRGLDVASGSGVNVVADMTDFAAVQSAITGATSVIDLAADSDADARWHSVCANNLPATINAFEAARMAGVKRIVFASSNHVVGMYERDQPYASVVAGRYEGLDSAAFPRIDETSPIRPDGPYGIGKAFGEAAARFYWEEHGISVICLRIGSVNRGNRPTNQRHFATLLTHRDLIQLVQSCLGAPLSVGFVVVYGVSANTWRIWDIERPRDLIGYAPKDDAERWR